MSVEDIALGARCPLDELAHVVLCARTATELGGGTEAIHDPSALVVEAAAALRHRSRGKRLPHVR